MNNMNFVKGISLGLMMGAGVGMMMNATQQKKSGKSTGNQSAKHGNPYIAPQSYHNRTNCGTRRNRAVHRKVGNIEYLISYIHADCHDAPDHSLGDSSRQSV